MYSQMRYQWNDLDAAVPPLMNAVQIAEQWGHVGLVAMCHAPLARVYQARGESERAVGALEEAARLLPRVDNVSRAAWIRAERARYWLAAGNLDAVGRWAQDSGLSLEDAFTSPKRGVLPGSKSPRFEFAFPRYVLRLIASRCADPPPRSDFRRMTVYPIA